MKKLTTLILSLLCLTIAQAQGIEFQSGSWAEIQAKAKQLNRPIFIDVYTSWCGPCKMMATETFPQKEAGDFFNANFVNYKIDAEKGEGIEIAAKYGVDSYPTCLFIAPNGETVSKFMGYKKVPQLLKEGRKALDNYAILPELEKMNAEYAAGQRDKAFLKSYLEKRRQFGETGGQATNDYVNQLTDAELVEPENTKWLQAIDVYDKALTQRLIDRLKAYREEVGDKKAGSLNNAIMVGLTSMVNQAVASDNVPMFDQFIDFKKQMNAINPTNDDNVIMASMGGGLSYLTIPQISLSFYMTNKHDKEFGETLLAILDEGMTATPVDTLINFSDLQEREYQKMLHSDTLSVKEKDELKRGRGLMDMMMGMKNNLMASALFNATERYWTINQPATDQLRNDYASWLRYIYALDRSSKVATAVAEKLVDIDRPDDARWVLTNALDFLKLKEAPAEEIQSLEAALSDF